MKALILSATMAAALAFAAPSFAQNQTGQAIQPGGNPEYPSAGAKTYAPSPQEQVTRTPGSAANPEFPSAGSPAYAPSAQEQVTRTPGSAANPAFPSAGAPAAGAPMSGTSVPDKQ